ncbi:MAG: hypothetical protein R6U50_04480 [Desulfobacterales bacterium]
MSDQKKIKEIPGLKQIVGKELVGNAIVMIILVLASWGLTFGVWGPPEGLGTYLGYIACMVPFFTVIQTAVPLINKRVELMHGKWGLKADEKDLPAEPLITIWSRILPRAFVYGFGTMLVLVGLIKVSGWYPGTPAVVIIVLVVNITTTSLLIKRFLPADLLSWAKAAGSKPDSEPQPLAGYLVVEHGIPFILLQAYINACVANRGFHFEAAKAGVDYVPLPALLPDAFILFVILAFIQWMFSNNLTRGHVHLGRVPVDRLNPISGWGGIGLIFLGAIVVTLLYWAILAVGNQLTPDGIHGLSIGMATLFKMGNVVLSVIFGAWIGIRWGGTREHARMQV